MLQDTNGLMLTIFVGRWWRVAAKARGQSAPRHARPLAGPDRVRRLIPAAAAASLGLALTGVRPTTAAVVEQLADMRMVVLLDNCEHLLGACAEFAMALLQRCAGVAVLATSREPLRLPGEMVWRVPSLELPDLRLPANPARLARLDSVRLFLERAGNASPAFRLDSATALAAAELAARLDDVLATLAGRIHGVPDRQATLAATLDWSHDLLADDERAVFRRLSVFAGGFALDAAEEVCRGGLSEPVAVVVSRLVDKSLVTVETSGGLARFRLLEVIRQYAVGCLASSGELACHQRRHALWYASQAESLDPDLSGGVIGEPSPWFALESGNLRAALSTSLGEMPDRALVMAVAMWRSWMARGLHAEGLRWLAQALEACPAPSPLRAQALFAVGVLEVRLGRPRLAGGGASPAVVAHLDGGRVDSAVRLASDAATTARGIASVRATHEHLDPRSRWLRDDPDGCNLELAAVMSGETGPAGRPIPGEHAGVTSLKGPSSGHHNLKWPRVSA